MLYMDPYHGESVSLMAKIEQEAQYMNKISADFWYTYLLELGINRYEWVNLPPEIDTRFLELALTLNGSALFYYDPGLDKFLALEYASYGPETVYRDPINRAARTMGYVLNENTGEYEILEYRDLTPENSVLIWNNSARTCDLGAIRFYTQRLTELDRAYDVNLRGQKTPKLLRTTREQQVTINNLIEKYDGNVPFIVTSKIIDPLNDIIVIDTSVPYLLDKLSIEHKTTLSRAHTYFGVENASTDKKERQVTDEVISNLGGVAARRYAGLKTRKIALEEMRALIAAVNEVYGKNYRTDISVKYSLGDMLTIGEIAEQGQQLEISENGGATNE